jgi:hypothetical protein
MAILLENNGYISVKFSKGGLIYALKEGAPQLEDKQESLLYLCPYHKRQKIIIIIIIIRDVTYNCAAS